MPRKKLIQEDGIVTPSENTVSTEAQLRNEVEELKRMVAMLIQEKTPVVSQSEEDDEQIDIRPDKYISVVSLCPMPLTLSTLGMGQGKVFTFEQYGKVKRILYSDLVLIMENQNHFLEQGYFYILDQKVIRKHGLDEVYSKLLSKEQIETILNGSMVDALALYKGANETQRLLIADMLIEKIYEGAEIDMNIVIGITKLSGVDILSKAEEAKAYQSEVNEK